MFTAFRSGRDEKKKGVEAGTQSFARAFFFFIPIVATPNLSARRQREAFSGGSAAARNTTYLSERWVAGGEGSGGGYRDRGSCGRSRTRARGAFRAARFADRPGKLSPGVRSRGVEGRGRFPRETFKGRAGVCGAAEYNGRQSRFNPVDHQLERDAFRATFARVHARRPPPHRYKPTSRAQYRGRVESVFRLVCSFIFYFTP